MSLALVSAQEDGSDVEEPVLNLAQPGPYGVGVREMVFVDPTRNDRAIQTSVYYPIVPDDASYIRATTDAAPDLTEAPYPLILYSHSFQNGRNEGRWFLQHLTSYGFVVAAGDHRCDSYAICLIDRPLDILFLLDELAIITDDFFAGLVDADTVGVAGYSQGGYTTLATAGAQIDPDFFLEWYTADTTNIRRTSFGYLEGRLPWDFDDEITVITEYCRRLDQMEDGLCPSITDERIQAIMPMVPSMTPLFGERGSESISIPILTLAGTNDSVVSYEQEIVRLYQQTENYHSLISFIDGTHYIAEEEDYLQHFSVAFFGLYLQGHEDYAEFVSEDYVNQFPILHWGILPPPPPPVCVEDVDFPVGLIFITPANVIHLRREPMRTAISEGICGNMETAVLCVTDNEAGERWVQVECNDNVGWIQASRLED